MQAGPSAASWLYGLQLLALRRWEGEWRSLWGQGEQRCDDIHRSNAMAHLYQDVAAQPRCRRCLRLCLLAVTVQAGVQASRLSS